MQEERVPATCLKGIRHNLGQLQLECGRSADLAKEQYKVRPLRSYRLSRGA